MFRSTRPLLFGLLLILIKTDGTASKALTYFDDINELAQEEMTMDQLLMNAADSSEAMDFIADENTVLVELDILYDKYEWEEIEEFGSVSKAKRSLTKRKAIHDKRWTNKEIPYIISNVFDADDKREVHAAMDEWSTNTCIKFRPASGQEQHRIQFTNGAGCRSYVGMTYKRAQDVNLAKGCRRKGIIMHELGHAVGFHHEQTRPDREQFVTLNDDNIAPSMTFNFKLYNWETIKDYGVPYDYSSIMHYGQYSFSKNGESTMDAVDKKYQEVMGNRKGFSFRDVKVANLMYDCAAHCPQKRCPGEGFVGKDCKCWCPGFPYVLCDDIKNKRTTEGAYTYDDLHIPEKLGGFKPSFRSKTSICHDALGERRCKAYSKLGYCSNESHKDYMSEKCTKSCGKCSTSSTGNVAEKPVCKDKHGSCSQYKSLGYCSDSTYRKYMSENCAKTCAVCSKSTTSKEVNSVTNKNVNNNNNKNTGEAIAEKQVCKNMNKNCEGWAKSDKCSSYYKNYMKKYCPKACGFCDVNAKENKGKAKERCADRNMNCASWAGRGECRRNPAFMNYYCKQACGECSLTNSELAQANTGKKIRHSGGAVECVDKDKYCDGWARRGECSKNPSYMHMNCRKSCKKC
ncbi:uncharacterized protein LOC141915299 [Tubulanus polymorphus]|uniref:uncharacterized protein LOC141915299 n=1 Tax=Tubulanus polymorphus TaxID=672921 RepID=UPI003DA5A002